MGSFVGEPAEGAAALAPALGGRGRGSERVSMPRSVAGRGRRALLVEGAHAAAALLVEGVHAEAAGGDEHRSRRAEVRWLAAARVGGAGRAGHGAAMDHRLGAAERLQGGGGRDGALGLNFLLGAREGARRRVAAVDEVCRGDLLKIAARKLQAGRHQDGTVLQAACAQGLLPRRAAGGEDPPRLIVVDHQAVVAPNLGKHGGPEREVHLADDLRLHGIQPPIGRDRAVRLFGDGMNTLLPNLGRKLLHQVGCVGDLPEGGRLSAGAQR
mmetsp:Transcript_57899/g.183653  ORF Transcript_57899/g.183653 Transcript_57899/m.183653 type:complete len:269 (-) Transcript_57899:456-1262(-)